MDTIGLVSDITDATTFIDAGRKGFATKGKAEEGRISFEKGISEAILAFQKAQTSADPKTIFLLEYTFISQELHFCDKCDRLLDLGNRVHGLYKTAAYFNLTAF